MKTILISGANGNLGAAVVKLFLERGYGVVALDQHDDKLGFAKAFPVFSFAALDLLDEAAVSRFVGSVIALKGSIEGALMIAGGFAAGSVEDTDGTDIHRQLSINFDTAYFLTRPLLKHMKSRGYGRLVFIGARPALNPDQGKGLVAYALSKSLLFKLADFINEDSKLTNVVASMVVPSTIDTPGNRSAMPDADPALWVRPEQIAEVLEFICSDRGIVLREPIYKVYNNA